MATDEQTNRALEIMRSRLSADGIAVLKVDDGTIFMFTRDKLHEMEAQMDAESKNEIILFVRSGPMVDDPAINN